jgi:hypothetical protein
MPSTPELLSSCSDLAMASSLAKSMGLMELLPASGAGGEAMAGRLDVFAAGDGAADDIDEFAAVVDGLSGAAAAGARDDGGELGPALEPERARC